MSDLSLPIGTHVIVTGDTEQMSHCIAAGTHGTITGHGVKGYHVEAWDTFDEIGKWFVHPNDVQEITDMPDEPTTYPVGAPNPDVKGFMRTDGTPIIDVEQRKIVLEWTLEHFPEDSVVDLVKLANWVLTGEYR